MIDNGRPINLSPFMRVIFELEMEASTRAAEAPAASTRFNGHKIECRQSYHEVHKFRGTHYREYWLDGVKMRLPRIQELLCKVN